MNERDGAATGGMLDRIRTAYWQRPVVAWGATAVVVGIIVAVVVIVAVGGAEDEPANVSIDCSVSDSDGATVLTIRGKVTQKEADEGCNAVTGDLSGEGRYWRVGLPQSPGEYPEVVCAFNAPEGEQGTVLVEADPESFSTSATAICGEFAHEGWTQFAQGGVMGPWQRQYQDELEAQEEAERVEGEIREEEQLEWERREEAVFRCEERAEANEEAELEAIERETEERMAEAGSEAEEFRLEEEGWEAEEQAWERGEAAYAECPELDSNQRPIP